MSSIRFVKGDKPELVKQGKLQYQAGHLSLVGRNSIPKITATVKRYLKETFGWDEENPENSDITAFGVSETLLSDAFLLILACDYTEKLKPADLLEWDEDFVDQCLKVVFELNPRFVRKKETGPDTGHAQPETHKADGTPKEPEELPLA